MNGEAFERPRTESQARPTLPIREATENTLAFLSTKDLPVFNRRDEITNLIHAHDRVIIEAETGSGKSTVTPVLALAELASRKETGKVIVTQPRRMATEDLDEYLGTKLGDRVGYRNGGGSNVTKNTRLEFTIERSLLNDMIRGNDPLLIKRDVDTVILDEVHERKVDLDILMPLLKQAQVERQKKGRPLKIILTSATMEREKMLEYFEGSAHLEVEGKMFKVEQHFAKEKIDPQDLMIKAAQKAAEIHARGDDEPGDMLIFMPGKDEIEKTIEALNTHQNLIDDEVEFISLIGGDESKESRRKIHQKSNKRRIFIGTNVAETSITIPSVRVVIDSGLMRLNMFNPQTGISGLETREHTQSNAKQRRGRAGRTNTGTAHFLFTEEEFKAREQFLPAEILRTDLITQLLLMKQLGINNIANFDWLDHPGTEKINQAEQTLRNLGALTETGMLNEVGKQMADIDTEPRFARMMVEARKYGCEEEVSLIAGILQATRPIFDRYFKPEIPFKRKYAKFVTSNSDISTLLNIWNDYSIHNTSKDSRKAWSEENGINTRQLYNASNTRKEILRNKRVQDKPIDLTPDRLKSITNCVITGLVDNIVIRKNGDYRSLNGTRGIRIDKNSTLANTRPDTFVSGVIRKTKNYPPFAGFNIETTLEEIQKIAPYLELGLLPLKPQVSEYIPQIDKPIIKESEPPVTITHPEISHAPIRLVEPIRNQLHKENIVNPKAPPVNQIEDPVKQESKLTKIKNTIKSWLKKLKLIR